MQARAEQLFSPTRLQQLSAADRPFADATNTGLLVNAALLMSSYAKNARTLALEGTVVTPRGLMFEVNKDKHEDLVLQQKKRQDAAARLGPTIACSKLDLANMYEQKHGFYANWQEFYVGGNLTEQLVLHPCGRDTNGFIRAGASPRQVTSGEFCMTSLCRLSDESTEALRWAARNAQRHRILSLPHNRPLLTSVQKQNTQASLDVLNKLDTHFAECTFGTHEFEHELFVSPATVANNPRAVVHLATVLQQTCKYASVKAHNIMSKDGNTAWAVCIRAVVATTPVPSR